MLFTSFEFLLLFCPVFFLLYYILPIKLRNYWLLLASLVFYAWGEPVYVMLLIVSIVINYALALRIEELPKETAGRKCVFIVAIILNVSLLVIFKYLNFIMETVNNAILTDGLSFQEIALPLGISFFTFQAISYIVDVYRGGVQAQRNIGYLGLYIAMFPRITAGPIVRYSSIADQIAERKVTVCSFSDGIIRFIIGFNKKMLISNIIADVADKAFQIKEISILMAWLGAICYALQIYYDFSGYSDMAIGLGKLLGFNFPENFDYPYISKTITEFWRRWHISLGSWFRDYVYFPMGGSRVKTKRRLVRNLMVVWLLTGIWHGANWTFILWGILYGVVLIFEKMNGIPKKMEQWKKPAAISYRILTLLLVVFGWVLFRSSSIAEAWLYLKSMFGLTGNLFADENFVFYSREYIVYILAGIVCSMPIFKTLKERCKKTELFPKNAVINMGYILQLVLFVVSITMLVMNTHNPFIYNQF